MNLITVAVQLITALAVSGVVMTALGFSQPPVSRVVTLLVTALGVGGAVWLAGMLLGRPTWRTLLGAIAGGAAGYALIALGAYKKLMELLPGLDSIYLFALCASAPAVAGYWLFRGRHHSSDRGHGKADLGD